MLAAIQWPFKLIQHRGYDRLNNSDELFDLENDPDELGNLTSQKHLPRLLSSKKHTKSDTRRGDLSTNLKSYGVPHAC